MVGYGYLGKVRKFQQPKTNTFIYVKNLGGGGPNLLPPSAGTGLIIFY